MKNTVKAFDFETTSLDPRKGRAFGYVLTDSNGNSKVYDLDGPGRKGRIARRILIDTFEDTSIEKVIHNLKFELHFLLRAEGIIVPEDTIFHDTMIMSQICNNLEKSHKLEDLTNLYCNIKLLVNHWKIIDRKVKFQANARGKRYDRVDRPLMHEYQKNDGFRAMLLYKHFKPLIQPFWENYRNEIALISATQRMEDFGLYPSEKNIDSLLEWLATELGTMTNKLFYLLNGFENFNSDDIVRKYLYDFKNYPVNSYSNKGLPSVDKDAFFKLLDDFPEAKEELNLILRYRSYIKAQSMIESYKEAIHPSDGLVHHTINTNSARTGRQSAKDPNMQNVSKKNALKNPFPVPARKCFECRPDGILLFVDYSGIEMRLIIEATKEPTMTKVLQENGDVHSLASEYWFGDLFTDRETCIKEFLPHDDILTAQYKTLINEKGSENAKIEIFKAARYVLRSAGKNGQFALAYGANPKKISKTVNIPLEILLPGYDAYCSKFPLIADFTPSSMHEARKNGFVMTSFGRRLYISKTKIHTAANYKIQGTAAEMLKRSTVNLDRYLIKNNPDIRLIVPIHDELMMHVPKTHLTNLKAITDAMSAEMTNFPSFSVPIEVEWDISTKTWNDKISLEDFLENYRQTA